MMTTARSASSFHSGLIGPLAFALGLASMAMSAHAQTDKGNAPTAPPSVDGPFAPAAAGTPAAAAPDPVAGVTVDAQRRDPLANIPPDKLAEYNAQVARDEAFRKYRGGTQPLTADPNDQSKDFPGLQSYVPNK